MINLTQEYLHECFLYDAFTGVLVWKNRPLEHFETVKGWKIFNSKYAGKIAGCINKQRGVSHLIIMFSGKKHYYAHRIIWKMINGDGLDNRWNNLRDVTIAENSRNKPIQKSNTSGVTGVNWHKGKCKWVARINPDVNKRISLGSFDSFEEAVKVRKQAEAIYNYHDNHGRNMLN